MGWEFKKEKKKSKKTGKHALVQERKDLFKKKELTQENMHLTKKASEKTIMKEERFFFLGWLCSWKGF